MLNKILKMFEEMSNKQVQISLNQLWFWKQHVYASGVLSMC